MQVGGSKDKTITENFLVWSQSQKEQVKRNTSGTKMKKFTLWKHICWHTLSLSYFKGLSSPSPMRSTFLPLQKYILPISYSLKILWSLLGRLIASHSVLHNISTRGRCVHISTLKHIFLFTWQSLSVSFLKECFSNFIQTAPGQSRWTKPLMCLNEERAGSSKQSKDKMRELF